MSERPTPETDAAVWMTGDPWDEKDEVVCSDFARKLERERDEARQLVDWIIANAELTMWRDGNILHDTHRDELEKVERERDEARRERDIDSVLTYKKNLECLTERLYDRCYTAERERDYARQQNAQLRAELALRKEGGAQ